MKRLATLVAIILPAFTVACGTGEISEEDASAAWAATNRTLSGGQGDAANHTALTSADSTVDFSYDCPTSGTAGFAGDFEANDFTFTVDFDQCEDGDLKTDGSLTFTSSVVVAGTDVTTTFTYAGTLEWSGSVSGSCEIDMTGKVEATTGSALVEYSGTICGHDASAAISSGS